MQIKVKQMIAAGLVGLMTVAAAGCTPPQKANAAGPSAGANNKDIVIGVIAPITGDIATFGQSTKQAVELAAKQINAKGGINGKKVVLKIQDDKNDPTDAAGAALKLINQDKVNAIVGSVGSKATLAAAPIAQKSKIPMIATTASNIKVTQAGDFIFRACFIDPFQGQVMAKFAHENLGKGTAAVLYDVSNDYSKGLADTFKDNFAKLGGKITTVETYSKGDQDFNAQLTKIKGTNPDVLFLPDYYSTVGLIAKQARAQGIQAIFMGGDGWDSEDLVKIGGTAMEGAYFSNHYSPDNKNPEAEAFMKAYQDEYKAVPDSLAALAYDAITILFDGIQRANSLDGTAIRDAMASTKDFKAVSGKINFDADRNPIKSAVVIQVKDGKMTFSTQVNP